MKRLKDIYKYLQRRYGSLGNLVLFAIIALLMVWFEALNLIVSLETGGGDKYLAWMYACNLACLLVVSIQLLRLDGRRLLGNRTANILDTCGVSVILLMIIRSRLAKHVTSVDLDNVAFYSEDVAFIYLLGFVLVACAGMIRRAVKIKEEQDLTI